MNVREIYAARSFNKKIAHVERGPSSVQPWMYDNSGCADYDEELGVLFGGSIEAYAKLRKDTYGSLVVMDLMGHGQVLRELPVSAGVALALGDGRDDVTRESDNFKNIDTICGDILSKKTWEKTAEWVRNQKIEGIDIVLCRPIGGYNMLTDDPNIFHYLISNVWSLLSPNNGMLAAEVPVISLPRSRPYLGPWGEMLKSKGINFWKASSAVRLMRTHDSPDSLPKLQLG